MQGLRSSFISIKSLDNERIKTEYIDDKQTTAQLAAKHVVDKNTTY